MKKRNLNTISDELLVSNKYLYLYLLVANKLAGFLFKTPTNNDIDRSKSQPKILICNIAHLGDVVLSTCVLKQIKDRYPNSTIGFVCNSITKNLLLGHPLIDEVYCVDHWKVDRSNKSILSKLIKYIATFFNTLKQIKKYDYAIDLYYFYPNSVLLLALAKIPVRIGYISGGFKSLLTYPVKWVASDNSVMFYHQHLAQILTGNMVGEVNLQPLLKPLNGNSQNNIEKLLDGNHVNNFIIFHCGAGDEKKLWYVGKWIELTKMMTKKGYKIAFTGAGASDEAIVNKVLSEGDGISLCNKLSFDDLNYLIKNCKMLVCVDTLIVHIASAYNTPCIVITNNNGTSIQFKPMSTKSLIFDEFDDIKNIQPQTVYEKIISFYKS